MNPSSFFVELDKSVHDRKSFDCGEEELNRFLQQFAARNRIAGTSKTIVLPAIENKSIICAWYTLAHGSVDKHTLPRAMTKRLSNYPVPIMLIAQLAVHREMQGQGLGTRTLIDALSRAYEIDSYLPYWAVIVDALNDNAQKFYESFGFQAIGNQSHRVRLFLPMTRVKEIVAPAGIFSIDQSNLREPAATYIVNRVPSLHKAA